MARLEIVPGERGTGQTRRQSSVTRCRNRFVCTMLVEAARDYRCHFKVSGIIATRAQDINPAIRDDACRAQLRLDHQYINLTARGKHRNVPMSAVTRELVAFNWDAARLAQVQR